MENLRTLPHNFPSDLLSPDMKINDDVKNFICMSCSYILPLHLLYKPFGLEMGKKRIRRGKEVPHICKTCYSNMKNGTDDNPLEAMQTDQNLQVASLPPSSERLYPPGYLKQLEESTDFSCLTI